MAKEEPQFENEWRCANTYRLRREVGGAGPQEVDLYYQPVIYSHGECENGLRLRRVGCEAPESGFWTPDYLLVIREGGSERVHAIDAKHCYWNLLVGEHGRLADCVDKYLAKTRVLDAEGGGRPLDGVWILSGRLDGERAFKLDAGELLSAEEGQRCAGSACGVVPWNRNTGRRKRSAFFAWLGLA